VAAEKEVQKQKTVCRRPRGKKVELGYILVHKGVDHVVAIEIVETDDKYTRIKDDLGPYKYPTYEVEQLFLIPNRVYELLYA